MRKSFYILFLAVFTMFFLSAACLYSQSSNENFRTYTIDQGLSQSCVYATLQDHEGYMWFGTQTGLNKFNGRRFQIYQYDLTDSNSLSNNWIYSLAEDKNGNLWIGTRSGLSMLDLHTGKVKRYEYNPKNTNSIMDSKVYSVLIDKEGMVWVRTSNTLSKLNPKTGKFIHFDFQVDYFSIIERDYGWPIYEDKDGNIWFGANDGLHIFNKINEHFAVLRSDPSDPHSLSDNKVTAIKEDKYKNLWIGTGVGLNRYNKKLRSFTRYFHDKKDPNSLIDNEIMTMYIDHNNMIWIGTANGLSRYNNIGGTYTNFAADKNREGSLSHSTITSIYEDKSRNLWVGTDGGGVNKIDLKPRKYELYNEYNGLANNMTSSLWEVSKSILWVGSWDSGLDIFNRETGKIEHYSEQAEENNKINDDHIHAIFKDSRDIMWLGSKKGINIYNDKKKKFLSLNDYFKGDVKINSRVNSIVETKEKIIWVGTHAGLYMLNFETNEHHGFFYNAKDTNTLSDNVVYCVMEDADGDIWAGTFNGLNKISANSSRIHRYQHSATNPNSLSSNSIYSIMQDKDGMIWLATSYGLNMYNKKTNKFSYLTTKNGLPSEELYGIIEDDYGDIWITSTRGLSRFNKKAKTFKNYDKDDGLQGLEFNLGSNFKSSIDGEIFLGGIGGFNAFYPTKMKSNAYIPPIVITNISKKSNIAETAIPYENNQVIELSYQDYLLNIEFAALDFTNPEKNTYSYKIEGMTGQSDEWINIGNRSFVPFSNMPAGTYTIAIKGSNNDQVWNNKGVTIKVVVNPPFWKTIWAYILYVLVVSSVVYYYISTRTRKLKDANQILREKQYAALEIAKQKEDLSRKNKAITDSINYAKRIQEAMMPSEYLFNKLLTDAFILYKPKDIVSGDFYWITERKNKIFIAAVDCTGHGVPGAFMSIIGYDLLKTITKEREIENPAEILNQLNEGVADTFSKNVVDGDVKDGMDISLCVIDKNNKTLEYAGAINPLFIVRNNRIIEIKGNRFSVGSSDEEERNTFESHIMPLRDADMVYMFSDGYADQFGGPLGKKYKYRRFRHFLQTISGYPLKEQKKYLEDNITKWRGEIEQVDDVLIIGIRVTKSLN